MFKRKDTSSKQRLALIVTVCLSQYSAPFSLLQLFDFMDADHRLFMGTQPELEFEEQHDIDAYK